jgi:hypothetical protein
MNTGAKELIEVNMNTYVKVKLTDKGRDILAKSDLTISPNSDGYIEMQLWILMKN